ncbi:ubiquinol-cytochrome c reductase iron-sulfur subunit [Plebeiibacterium marinum]|uniref:Rieske (2Fe-2S) protein n=1 Tax=Plebeiibacterium marinum TaxID=2992111 RepID=A0AAE3MD77_9BACT|nr:Rieske (2Fe-2S) protein [Plebeiobacterium marinum]MCW3805549.1 Rieske (2Fe-2S) protein [Plebeiobacterium marinum]
MKFNRRTFIKRLFIAAASIETFFLIKGSISKTHLEKDKKELFNAGKADSFEKNKPYPFLTGQFFLRRFDDGGFIAMSIKCTHLGCIVQSNIKTGGFNCPCHASQFNRFGEVLSSPATRPLDYFPITIKNGDILVDTSKPTKRKSFSKSQLTYV